MRVASRGSRQLVAAVLGAAACVASGCSGGGGGASVDAAVPDATPACDEQGGDSFVLRVGKATPDGFTDLVDGQSFDLVWGYQGYLMLIFDLGADLGSAATDELCFRCVASATSPTGAFDTVSFDADFYFDPMAGDLYKSQTILVLGDDNGQFQGAEADVAATCEGNQRSGSVAGRLTLNVPPR